MAEVDTYIPPGVVEEVAAFIPPEDFLGPVNFGGAVVEVDAFIPPEADEKVDAFIPPEADEKVDAFIPPEADTEDAMGAGGAEMPDPVALAAQTAALAAKNDAAAAAASAKENPFFAAAEAARAGAEAARQALVANPNDPEALAAVAAALETKDLAAAAMSANPEAAAVAATATKAAGSAALAAATAGEKLDAGAFSTLTASTGADFVNSLSGMNVGQFAQALDSDQLAGLTSMYGDDPDFLEFAGLPPTAASSAKATTKAVTAAQANEKYFAASAARDAAETAIAALKANPNDPIALAAQTAALAAKNDAAAAMKADPVAAAAAAAAVKAGVSAAIVAGGAGQKIDATVFSTLTASTGADFVDSLSGMNVGQFAEALEPDQLAGLQNMYGEDAAFREFVGLPPLDPGALAAKNVALAAAGTAAADPLFAAASAARAAAETARVALKANPNDPEAIAAQQAANQAKAAAAALMKADPAAAAAAAAATKAAADAAVAAATAGEQMNDAVFATMTTAATGEDFVNGLAGATAAQFAAALAPEQLTGLVDMYGEDPEFREFAGLPPTAASSAKAAGKALETATANPMFAAAAAARDAAEAARVALKSNPDDPEAKLLQETALQAKAAAAALVKADPVAAAAADVATKAAASAVAVAAASGGKMDAVVFSTLTNAGTGADFVQSLGELSLAELVTTLATDQAESIVALYLQDPVFRTFAGLPALEAATAVEIVGVPADGTGAPATA